jgi:bla regulator protein BlaR1
MIDTLKTAFMWVLVSSFTGSILTIAVMLIQKIFKKRISPRVYCILWLLVFIRLAVPPFAPGSPISVFNIFSYKVADTQKENTTHLIWNSIIKNKPYSEYTTTENSGQTTGLKAAKPNSKITTGVEEKEYDVIGRTNLRPDIWCILSIVWVSGFLVAAFILFYSGKLFSMRLKNSQRSFNLQLLSVIESCKRRLEIRKEVSVFISNYIATPCMTGLSKPKLVIPQKVFEFADCQQLTHICMHELSHFKRMDNLINLPVIAIAAIHWFNPLLWYALRQFNLSREISCDARVLEALGQEECVPYGMTLISFIRFLPQKRLQFSHLEFCETKKQIERRIIMIKIFKKGSYKISAIAVVLCLTLGSITLTNAVDSTVKTVTGSVVQDDANSKVKLGDSYYCFFSMDRVGDFTSLKNKVPDYLPSGYGFRSTFLFKNDTCNEDTVDMLFCPLPDSPEHNFHISASKGDLLKETKNVQNTKNSSRTFQEEPMKISNIYGTCLTEKYTFIHGKDTIENIMKFFIWKDNDIWYSILYDDHTKTITKNSSSSNTSSDHFSISNDDLQKITGSMKQLIDVKNISYTSSRLADFLNIYDEKDLTQAEKMLGFAPKFPINLPGGFTPKMSSVDLASDADNPKLTGHRMHTYFLSKETVPRTKNAKASVQNQQEYHLRIDYYQGKEWHIYSTFKNKKGHFETKSRIAYNTKNIKGKSLNIANIEVFCYDDGNSGIHYLWKQSNVYYQAKFDNQIKAQENIIKALVMEKSSV